MGGVLPVFDVGAASGAGGVGRGGGGGTMPFGRSEAFESDRCGRADDRCDRWWEAADVGTFTVIAPGGAP